MPPRIALAAFALCATFGAAAGADASAADGLAKCQPGMVLPVWQPQDGLTTWDRLLRGFVYFALLSYFFLGVSIGSDRFMGAIEVITSQEREVLIRKKGSAQGQRVRVRVWNETIANLTLMALGSSAPEILLSIIEIVGKNFAAGELGPGTIVGSAAYNLFVIIAICVHVIPDGEVRRIRHLSVFFVTATWSVFAYIWMYMILAVISEGVVECWEAFITFLFFPATVLTAYVADRKLRIFGFKRFRLNKNRVIVAAEGDDGDQQRAVDQQLEDEILEESSVTDPHHFAIILRDLKKRNSNATPKQLEQMAIDELTKRTHKSKAFYRLQANKQLTGGVAQTHLRRGGEQHHAEVTAAATVRPLGCKISLQPDHYTVLENVGQFEVSVVREGDDLSHSVSVFYTTEDGTAVAGSDYEGATGTVVFGPGETRQTIALRVIDDDIFEEDEHFYLHLTKAVVLVPNGSGAPAQAVAENVVALGPPATATIVILDDDHCGVFGFASESVEVSENVGVLRLEVVRSSGARGAVRLDYVMIEDTAKHERHFVQRSGTLVFENNEARLVPPYLANNRADSN
ncbi:hypothetical protein V9T40_014694 [Parthenolecanium corni]|uniref:Calx-beta domain-containing protein n=1 Tax=Parthenolecanium corni TaxID=536013 RepID=A0AAN9T2K4_9HEMI